MKTTLPQEWPEENSSFFSRITYSFMSPLLRKSTKASLSEFDLYKVSKKESISTLQGLFRSVAQNATILRRLAAVGKEPFLRAGFCQLVAITCQTTMPLIMYKLINLIEQNETSSPPPNFLSTGLFWSSLMGLAVFFYAFFANMQIHLAMRTGMRLRATLISELYLTTLELSPEGRKTLHSGELTNLSANDAQKIFEVFQEAHLIWSAPLQAIVVSILLVVMLGWVTIVGILILFSILPTVKIIIKKMLSVRSKRMPITDERVNASCEVLTGIKITKLNFWEESFYSKITTFRSLEMKYIREELFVWGITLCLTVMTPVLATGATFTCYALLQGKVLTAADIFSVLSLFSTLRFPINDMGKLLGNAAQAYNALLRIGNYLDRDTSPQETGQESSSGDVDIDVADDVLLEVSGADFLIGGDASENEETVPDSTDDCDADLQMIKVIDDDAHFSLVDVNFKIRRNKFYAIIGGVGSGKSSLVRALIGLMLPTDKNKSVKYNTKKISYSAQSSFIMNTSLKGNILFGAKFDKDKYSHVLRTCALESDLLLLPRGDQTEIGERGVNLSGGQKARVSLARAIYATSDVVFLDDPLSALDADTGRAVFQNLKSSHLTKNRAVVFVTSASHFLSEFDDIMLLHDGRTFYQGDWEGLNSLELDSDSDITANKTRANKQEVIEVLNHIKSSIQQESSAPSSSSPRLGPSPAPAPATSEKAIDAVDYDDDKDDTPGGKIIAAEIREFGMSKIGVWLAWGAAAGGFPFIFCQVLFMSIDRLSYISTEWWLARWSEASGELSVDIFGHTFPPQKDDQWPWVRVYLIITAVSTVAVFIRTEWAVYGGARAAECLFLKTLKRTLRAPMSFFESVPLGRLLNRFTYDIEQLDIKLSQSMSMLMISISWFCSCVGVMIGVMPLMICVLAPVTVVYYKLMIYYRLTSVDLQRLDAKSRSPVQSLLTELLQTSALDTITVFKQQPFFKGKMISAINENTEAMLAFTTAQRWFGIRIDLLGFFVTLVACIGVVAIQEWNPVKAGLAGLLLNWSSNFSITLQFLVRAVTESEAAITSVERVLQLCSVQVEGEIDKEADEDIDADWPKNGTLEFKNVSARYRDGLPLALKGMSFKVESGQKIGIVGRTGAGKSTITSVVYRLIEVANEDGCVLIDDVDIGKIGLRLLRGRENCLCIIPQDPTLFSGSVRECIDPFYRYEDSEIATVLKRVRLTATMDNLVEEGGKNFSVGERQLLILARSLLAKPKILVLDEASASLDGETDNFIQEMLREAFSDCTIICIAHRLATIMDYDKILCVSDGVVDSFDSPRELLKKKDGLFSKLVDSTGEGSSQKLRTMVR